MRFRPVMPISTMAMEREECLRKAPQELQPVPCLPARFVFHSFVIVFRHHLKAAVSFFLNETQI